MHKYVSCLYSHHYKACTDFYHFIQCPPVIGRPHIPTLNRCKKLQNIVSNYDGCNIIQLRNKCVSNFTFINLKIFLWEKFNFCRVVVKWLKEIDANNLSLSEKCHEYPIEESEKCPSWKVIKQLCDILRMLT